MPKQEDKAALAAAKMAERSKKKTKGNSMNYYIAVGIGGGSVILAVFLAATDGPKKKGGGISALDSLVNDRSFITSMNSEAGGNFTAAASPVFDAWTYSDVKWGLDGQILASQGFVGMAGALSKCDENEDIEGGMLPPAYDVRDSWSSCIREPIDSTNCSSSYAIAAATSLESRFCIGDNDKYAGLKLSAQQVLSCDKKSKGCMGGGIDTVFNYIKRRGLYPEECVPYVGAKGTECKTTCAESKKFKMLSHCVLSGEKAIKREIMNNGPIVAPVFLKDDYLVYSGGVYTPVDSSKQQYGEDGKPIMIATTVLGWGKTQGVAYWITSNSFGTKWGDKGLAYIAIGNGPLREDYGLVATAGTEENLALQAKKDAAEAIRKEEVKKERAERDERIRERQGAREAEMRAQREAADDAEFEDDVDLDLDLDDLDDKAEGGDAAAEGGDTDEM